MKVINIKKLLLILTVFVNTIFQTHAAPGAWSTSGPEGGVIYDIVAENATPSVFYIATRGGIYKTTDGAITWTRINNGITINFIGSLAHHSTLADIVYAAGFSSVFKTIDGGLNWVNISTGLPSNDNINNLSMSPTSANTIYLSTSVNSVYKTTDGGLTWLPANTGLMTTINSVRVSPSDPDRVYAATPTGLFESINGGMSWTDVSAGIATPYTASSAITNIQFAGFSGDIYLTSFSGTYKSTDNGATFIHQIGPSSEPIAGDQITVNPSNSNEVIISGSIGVWTTTNGGTDWSQALSNFPGNATEVANSRSTAYDPFNTTRILAGTDSNGIYLKTSFSPTWQPSNSGLFAENIRGLAIHPGLSSRIYAAIGDVFSPANVHFISDDSGATWTQSNSGLTALNFRDIEVDPFTAGSTSSTHVYGVGRDIPTTLFSGGFSDGDGGIYKSLDGGNTWASIDTGIPLTPGSPSNSLFGTVRDLTMDLSSSVAGGPVQTLYIAGSGRFTSDGVGGFTKTAARIYKSTDAGANWSPADTGIAERTSATESVFPAAVKIVIDPSDSNILYAATFLIFFSSTAPTPTIDNGVWKSIDAGVNWTHSSNGLPRLGGAGTSTYNVLSLVIDPVSSNRLYASVHNQITFESQIYKSEDSGASWTLTNTGIPTSDVRDIAIDSTGAVYAAAAGNAGNPGGVYRSTDFGASWQSINVGFDSLTSATQLKIDESGSNTKLYAGTTQSVYSIELLPDMDIDGVSNSVESAAPNTGDGNNDGTLDSMQNNVSSLPMTAIDNNIYKSLSLKGLTPYATVEIIPVSGTCTNLEDVQSVTGNDVPNDAPRSFDYGIIRFEIVDCQQAKVLLTYHGAIDFNDPAWAMRIFAPSQSGQTDFKWQTLPSSVTGKQWAFDLIDGQLGDIRPNNGRILFQGGAGFFNENVFVNGFE